MKRPVKRKKRGLLSYRMPRSQRIFRLDAEIGKYLMELPSALTEAEIIRFFNINKKMFDARARRIAPILKEAEKRNIMDLLYQMGKEPRGKKRV